MPHQDKAADRAPTMHDPLNSAVSVVVYSVLHSVHMPLQMMRPVSAGPIALSFSPSIC